METPKWALDRINQAKQEKMSKLDLGLGSTLNGYGGSNKKLVEFPMEICELPFLTELNIQNNNIQSMPEEFSNLENLINVNLSGNQLDSLPTNIGELKKLKILNLGGNLFTNLPDGIFDLENIEFLNLYSNKLTDIPNQLTNLSKLLVLHLSNNLYTNLPNVIVKLDRLTELYLSHNQLSDLPEEFSNLKNLKKLNLSHNDFRHVPECITELNQLKLLDLGGNRITNLPITISKLNELQQLIVSGNPILTPPIEVISRGIDYIREYYRQLDKGYDYLYEAKLLLLGEGGAGKTTLAQKIIDPNYSLQDEKSTEGIDVLNWSFPVEKERSFRANIWDFGGQEIYHSTHQYFLTKRSLYILVADTRKEDTDFYYWLNIVELLSDNSPLLIVKNEKQDRHREINERQLRGQFENLKEVLSTNLATNRNLDKTIEEIKHYIKRLPHVGSPLPKTWVVVREILEKDTRNYIFLEEYISICRQNGFNETKDILQLSGYLHDLGVFLHFQDDDLLKRTVILKPKWGTDAAYKVLDNKDVIRNLGHFTREDLARIWDSPEYADMHGELLQLMMKFRLCYEIPNTGGTYIAPQLLTENQPQYDWDDNGNLNLKYTYTFMPKGILTQFIVTMHPNILEQKYVWKSGVILEKDNTYAEIIEHYGRREISIRIRGMHKKDLMAIIMHELDKIHASYRRLNYTKLIPCNCANCRNNIQQAHYYQFDRLQRFIEDKQEKIQCQQSYYMINVRSLIDDVFGEDYDFEYDEDLEHLDEIKGVDNMSQSPQININVSNNSKIGNVILNSKIQRSFNQVDNANINLELKENLKSLAEAVDVMSKRLPPKAAGETANHLDMFINEVIKDEPNPKWYKVTAQGLIKAAENLGKIGKPVISLVGKILSLLG